MSLMINSLRQLFSPLAQILNELGIARNELFPGINVYNIALSVEGFFLKRLRRTHETCLDIWDM